MFRLLSSAVILLFLVILQISCQQSTTSGAINNNVTPTTGIVTVAVNSKNVHPKFSKVNGYIYKTIGNDTVKFDISGRDSLFFTPTNVLDLAVGTYTVVAEVVDSLVRYRGVSSVEVKAGLTSKATISMVKLIADSVVDTTISINTGSLTYLVDLKGAPSNIKRITGSLVFNLTSETIPIAFSVQDSLGVVKSVINQLKPGTYKSTIYALDSLQIARYSGSAIDEVKPGVNTMVSIHLLKTQQDTSVIIRSDGVVIEHGVQRY